MDALKLPVMLRRFQPLRVVFTIALGVAVMTLAAKAQVPFWPVPMTLHTLAVMAFAVGLGPHMALSIFAAYLAAGATGLPVFSGSPAQGVGLAYMAGPTGGYLAGYLVASWVVGVLASGASVMRMLAAMLAGLVIVYAAGILWLSVFVPAKLLLATGVAPFVLGDLLKIAVVAVGAGAIRSRKTATRGDAS